MLLSNTVAIGQQGLAGQSSNRAAHKVCRAAVDRKVAPKLGHPAAVKVPGAKYVYKFGG